MACAACPDLLPIGTLVAGPSGAPSCLPFHPGSQALPSVIRSMLAVRPCQSVLPRDTVPAGDVARHPTWRWGEVCSEEGPGVRRRASTG